jgi:hypothetical protein
MPTQSREAILEFGGGPMASEPFASTVSLRRLKPAGNRRQEREGVATPNQPYKGWPEARLRRVGPVKRGQNGPPPSQFCFLNAKSCKAVGHPATLQSADFAGIATKRPARRLVLRSEATSQSSAGRHGVFNRAPSAFSQTTGMPTQSRGHGTLNPRTLNPGTRNTEPLPVNLGPSWLSGIAGSWPMV